jgi:translation initiation factor 5B
MGRDERDRGELRTPIVCVLGHVDHGKTTFLDRIRGTNIATKEAGAITQHIGATEIPKSVIEDMCKSIAPASMKFKLPGLLFIDTPGHHAFTTLRKRGGALADLALLIVDIIEGFRPQTIESLNILRQYKTPFVVALNKIDKVEGWIPYPDEPFVVSYEKQSERAKSQLDERLYKIVGELYEQGFSAERYDRIKDFKRNVCIVPMSARTGEGIPDVLMVLIGLAQKYLEDSLRITVSGSGVGTVLEVREERGFGVTVDVILYDGTIAVGDKVVVGGKYEPVITKVRALLKPKPLHELRVEDRFVGVKRVVAASGVKVVAPDLENVVAGSTLRVVRTQEELENAILEIKKEAESVEIPTEPSGVVVKADVLGSLEAVANELKREDIPIRYADVGDISKRDVVEAEVSDDPFHRVVLGFNVRILPDAREEAEKRDVTLFCGDVIYKLVEDYQNWVKEQRQSLEKRVAEAVIKPAKVQILPDCVFRQSKPAIVGVRVLKGTLRSNVPLMRQDGVRVGNMKGMQIRGENVHEARIGDELAIAIEGVTVGRQIKEGDVLYVDIPENHAKVLEQDMIQLLREDEKDALEEILEIKRKENPFWGR